MTASLTKQHILDTALDLFSQNGFEATSTGQIADAVGIRKSSLYNHFESKQHILVSLIESLSAEFEKHSVFSDYDERKMPLTVDGIADQVRRQLDFLLHDEHISKVRRLLTIEQYRIPQISSMQTKRVYTDVLNYNTQLIKNLVENSVLKNGDIQIMAAQFSFPISAWISLCDREPEREGEAMELIERHIKQFFEIYKNN